MLPPLPRCSSWAYSSLIHPAVSAFPERGVGSACTSSFSGLAQRSLTLRPAHLRSHQMRDRYPGASDISSPPCLPRLLPAGAISPGGACTHWKAPPSHGARGLPTFASPVLNGQLAPRAVIRTAQPKTLSLVETAIADIIFQGFGRQAGLPQPWPSRRSILLGLRRISRRTQAAT